MGIPDKHGHEWYCFQCCTETKNHKSFDSTDSMMKHLNDKHGCVDWTKVEHDQTLEEVCEELGYEEA
jgi:hypothetical protein